MILIQLLILALILCGIWRIIKIMDHVINTSIPFIPEGFTLESHKDMGELKWDPKKIKLHLEPEQKDGYLKGNVLLERLKDKPVLNSSVLKYLLDHQEHIPDEWRDKDVYFWGTILHSSSGSRCVLSLCWFGGRWRWGGYWLRSDWSVYHPSAVLASPN